MSASAVELTIDSVAAGGDGVARHEGLVVFVPRSAPGDVVSARIESRGRFARATIERVLVPSPLRREPPCPHYVRDDCGGCQLQHLSYAAQLDARRTIIRDALVRIARRDAELPEVRPSPEEWRYRRKLTLALRWRRGRWIAGLHPYHDPRAVFALDDCPITQEPVLAVWKAIMSASAHFPRVPALRGAVRIAGGGASFVLEGGTAWPGARRFFDAVPALAALWWQPEGHRRRLIAERATASRGDASDSASFVQVNEPVSSALRAHVVERVRSHAQAGANSLARAGADEAGTAPGPASGAGATPPPSAERIRVVDCYAGSGDTAELLASEPIEVAAIELDRDAARRAGERLPPPSRAVRGAVEELLPECLPADIVIVNPPRAGLDERVTATLEQTDPKPRAVLYVSCNPATLARDLARMPAYRLASVLAFDMFPQTAHVETVCELVPAPEAA